MKYSSLISLVLALGLLITTASCSGLQALSSEPDTALLSTDFTATEGDSVADLAEAETRSTSTGWNRCQRHRRWDCSKCDWEKRRVVGICNVTERLVKLPNRTTMAAGLVYRAEVRFARGQGRKDGVTVTFKRNGQLVGEATTDRNGYARLSESQVPRGPHTITACVAAGRSCNGGQSYGQCSTGTCGSGRGTSTYDGRCIPDPVFCDPCVWKVVDGKICSTVDIAVYTEYIQGAVTGNGYIPTCDPLRPGLRDSFSFRIFYTDGKPDGYFNYSGGQYAGAWRVDNARVEWLVIAGNHSWFGGRNWTAHVMDNGPTYTDDFFEVWIRDSKTCCCYHCGGKLVGCYVKISYRYSE